MEENKPLDYMKFIFATVFIAANKLQVIGDHFLEELTTKQWLLLVMVSQFENGAPTLGQVATLIGSSHQNTKQLALKLEAKGYLKMDKDPEDNRILRLHVTEKAYSFFKQNVNRDNEFLRELFEAFDDESIKMFAKYIYLFQMKISEMDQSGKSEEFGWIKNLFQ